MQHSCEKIPWLCQADFPPKPFHLAAQQGVDLVNRKASLRVSVLKTKRKHPRPAPQVVNKSTLAQHESGISTRPALPHASGAQSRTLSGSVWISLL